MKTLASLTWHAASTEDTLDALATSQQGLAEVEVERRRAEFGRNAFPAKEALSLLKIILHQILSPLIYILLAAAAVSLAIGDFIDAGFILFVVLLNTALGAFQEWRAEQNAAALQHLIRLMARVRREGDEHRVDAEELVPGDIVLLESGEKVPADLRLLRANRLSIDESFLTGESLPARKDTEPVVEDATVGDRHCMAYAGSTVMTGRGMGVVVATGLKTELGKIAEATTVAEAARAPLVIRMEQFVKYLSYVVLVAVAVLGGISALRGMEFSDIFLLTISLAVAAIPEGLPAAMIVALSIGVKRMAQRHVIVRKMTAVEGLGSCTYVASDKTGTLTLNRQTISLLSLAPADPFEVTGQGYAGEGEILAAGGGPVDEADRERLREFARASVLCNEATLRKDKKGKWEHHGDPVDVAFLALGYKAGIDVEALRHEINLVSEVPFESERQFAAILYELDGRQRIAAKGSVERILSFCDSALTREGKAPVDPDKVHQEALRLSTEGFRVLAVAYADQIEDLKELDPDGMPRLTFLGLVGMIDPLRMETKDAVRRCREAGVEVAMITGDHPATALAIARQLEIGGASSDVVTGRELTELGDDESPAFVERVRSAHIFARVSPMQKLHIVRALGKLGHFVAVTGDGVNDAPALRSANIGVAMGSGSDVAKDSASIIVTDDRFVSIVDGIEEGRFSYDNIRKVIYLLISTGAAVLMLFIVAVFLGMPFPLLPVQILWLNLVTNGIQDIALAFEGGEPGAMRRPPRKPSEGILDRTMIQQVLVSGGVMLVVSLLAWNWLLNDPDFDVAQSRNLIFLTLVLFQNFHALNCRSERTSAFRVPVSRNPFLIIGIFGALSLHVASMHIPLMQQLLNTQPITGGQFLSCVLAAASVLVTMEIYKLVKYGREAAGD
ncbi:MAG: cation-translocating P-type ATPase [Bryobacteraceae bacterium]